MKNSAFPLGDIHCLSLLACTLGLSAGQSGTAASDWLSLGISLLRDLDQVVCQYASGGQEHHDHIARFQIPGIQQQLGTYWVRNSLDLCG